MTNKFPEGKCNCPEVDEADVVKKDGKVIHVLCGGFSPKIQTRAGRRKTK